MSRFEAATSISSLWKLEQNNALPFLRHVVADQLANSEPEHDLLSHTLHVRNFGNLIALRINKSFPNLVDPDLVASAGMIHDWGKIKQAPTINTPYSHYVRSQFDTAIHGFPAIGSIAGRHNFGALLRGDPLLLEQMILIYADIRSRTEIKNSKPIRTYKSLDIALPEIEKKL